MALPANMPRVIAVTGLKGGIGKSTLAMFIAFVYAIVRGQRVLYVDSDPSSQTGWDWWKIARDERQDPLPFDIEVWPSSNVGELVTDRTPGKYDVVIIDCGGDSDSILKAAVGVSTFALIVTTPNKADIRRLAATFGSAVKAAQEAGRAAEVDIAIAFTKVDNRRGVRNQQMRDQVAEAGLPLLESKLSLVPAIYADAMGTHVHARDQLAETEALVEEMEKEAAA